MVLESASKGQLVVLLVLDNPDSTKSILSTQSIAYVFDDDDWVALCLSCSVAVVPTTVHDLRAVVCGFSRLLLRDVLCAPPPPTGM